jgi:hypothetical protein
VLYNYFSSVQHGDNKNPQCRRTNRLINPFGHCASSIR